MEVPCDFYGYTVTRLERDRYIIGHTSLEPPGDIAGAFFALRFMILLIGPLSVGPSVAGSRWFSGEGEQSLTSLSIMISTSISVFEGVIRSSALESGGSTGGEPARSIDIGSS